MTLNNYAADIYNIYIRTRTLSVKSLSIASHILEMINPFYFQTETNARFYHYNIGHIFHHNRYNSIQMLFYDPKTKTIIAADEFADYGW